MKLTIASSSASDSPRRPTRLVFMLSVDSGAGQHIVPSPTLWGWQRGRTGRVHRGRGAEVMPLGENLPTPPSMNDDPAGWRHSPVRRADFPHSKEAADWQGF